MLRATALLLAACSYTPPGTNTTDTQLPSGPCVDVGTRCDNDMLLGCATVGQPPDVTSCNWGCIAETPAHCATVTPAGGALMGSDLEPAGRDDVVLTGSTIDSDGSVEGNVEGTFDHAIVNGIAVFRANSLRIDGLLDLRGSAPIAFAIAGDIVISAAIDVRGSCSKEAAGPGGSPGGAYTVNGSGQGGGIGVPDTSKAGAGGGSYGTLGGVGGAGNGATGAAAGNVHGDAVLTLLIGGSGGGGGGGGGGNDDEGVGGGGGGGVQFASNTTIRIDAQGSINAGGCGGGGSNNAGNDGSGAGGSGGTILLEAPTVDIAGQLAVNGGGGGGGNKVDGSSGSLGRVAATGGIAASGTGDGGHGAFANVAATAGVTGGAGGGGGGGGGLGRIRVNTRTGDVAVTGVMSPAFEDTTTATKATAVTQ